MNIGDFHDTYCRYCSIQDCNGPKTKDIKNCEYRFEFDEYVNKSKISDECIDAMFIAIITKLNKLSAKIDALYNIVMKRP